MGREHSLGAEKLAREGNKDTPNTDTCPPGSAGYSRAPGLKKKMLRRAVVGGRE